MRRVLSDVPTERVDLGDGDWVVVKTRRLLGDRTAIDTASIQRAVNAGSGNVELRLDVGAATLTVLQRMIVSWGGPGFCRVDHSDGSSHVEGGVGPDGAQTSCRPLPITPEVLDHLDDEVAQLVATRINAASEASSGRPTISGAGTG